MGLGRICLRSLSVLAPKKKCKWPMLLLVATVLQKQKIKPILSDKQKIVKYPF